MRAVSRACALGCLAAGVVAVRPAVASMTIALRDQAGHTRTFYQDGSRIRIANPSGTDDGEARIVDLETTEHVTVYDDARAYYDYNKSLAQVRAAIEQAKKVLPPDRKKPPPTVRFRALGEARQVNGFSCAMYERLVDGKADGQLCFAPWGGAVGVQEDFAWFDALLERMAADVAGKSPASHFHTLARSEGLVVWSQDDGRRPDTLEIVKVSREPLSAALFHVPPDYKEFSRPLSASEHPHIGPPPMDDGRASRSRQPLDRQVTRIVVIAMSIVIGLGLLIHAFILHLAASVVIDQNRFTQALLASAIIWAATITVELLRLPFVYSFAFGAFAVFAGLKISYGASIPRTLALVFVSGLFAAVGGYIAHGILG